MENTCLFCEIFENKIGVIFENDQFYARFDRFPVSPRHALVIPKRHVVSFLELTKDEQCNLLPAIKETIRIVENTDLKKIYEEILRNPVNKKMEMFCNKMLSHPSLNKKPDGYNIGVNEGVPAGRTIHHVHIQVIPRYIGDVVDFIGGIRHVIPGVGNYR